MPRIVRLFIVHTALGYVAAAVFVALLYWFDIVRLWSLVSASNIPVFATFLLWFFNGIVFSGAQIGIAIMGLAEAPDAPGGGKRAVTAAPAAVPAPARVSAPGARRARLAAG
ncbi:hypothetical protein R5H30_03570 [Sulfitobacter sp. D35]|uniref:hypothetical protein n=1 Tax=Sulfitobacter sp. D35 TaxID=3083252 RepID=UPI00296F33E2|nr:hypothetical protein [Sulfitobacter sp. D35]MDW4497048.1 hypothetical protein [Sulfitobacter sp. D35]